MSNTLEELLANATPGPWEYRVWGRDGDEWPDNRVSVGRAMGHGEAVVINPRYGERTQNLADARLIALAPDLARLALDMGDGLRKYAHLYYRHDKDLVREYTGLLARLDGLAAGKGETE